MSNQENNLENNPDMLDNEQNVSEEGSIDQLNEELVSEEQPQTEENTAQDENPIDEWREKYLRLVADFDNYKKRTNRERLDLIQSAGKDVIASLLDVLDDMDRAESQIQDNEEIEQIKEGIQLVFNKMRKVLQDQGLEAFDSIGKDFDVELHDAITEIPAPSEDLKSKVVDQVQKGYYLNDKLLRHAKVVVGK